MTRRASCGVSALANFCSHYLAVLVEDAEDPAGAGLSRAFRNFKEPTVTRLVDEVSCPLNDP